MKASTIERLRAEKAQFEELDEIAEMTADADRERGRKAGLRWLEGASYESLRVIASYEPGTPGATQPSHLEPITRTKNTHFNRGFLDALRAAWDEIHGRGTPSSPGTIESNK